MQKESQQMTQIDCQGVKNIQEKQSEQLLGPSTVSNKDNYNLLDYDEQFNSISFKENSQLDLMNVNNDRKQQMSMIQYIEFIKDRVIEIDVPQLVSDGLLTSYKLYTIKSKKRSSKVHDTCVTRRFSDFQYLQKQLFDKKGGCIIPLLPQKNAWASVNWQGSNFAVGRLKKLIKYAQALLDHQKLRLTPQVKNFLFFDDYKFSQAKGEFVQQIKTQDKVKTIAYNAYSYGYGLIEKLWNSSNQKVNQIKLTNPTKDDRSLSDYQLLINQFIRITGSLRKLVQSSVTQMEIVQNITQEINGKLEKDELQILNQKSSILEQFQEVCQYIQSCCSAIMRRKQIRLQLEELKKEQKNITTKIKNNPRSQQIDLIRAKLKKISNKCDNYTTQLLEDLSKSVHLGRSMIQKFIQQYSTLKADFYHIQ